MQIPIQTLHLFPKLDEKLISLLKSLSPEDWNKPTLATLWTVKDIASHLLDGNFRGVSLLRDGYFGDTPEKLETYQDIVDFLNRLNADWVKATKRMSPSLLIELLELTGKEYYEELAKLDPFKPALFSVAWAGQTESPNWFHIAREYTEKWHHQQQIRESVNKPGIMTREFYYPLINTFMQALPYTYRGTQAEIGTAIRVIVTSELGGEWLLIRDKFKWVLRETQTDPIKTQIEIDPGTAWKLFTKGVTSLEAEKKIKFIGDIELGKSILTMLSVMA
jgi:hypothetical protein